MNTNETPQETAAVEETTTAETANETEMVEGSTVPDRPKKRKGLRITLFSLLGLLVALVVAATAIAQPWVGTVALQPEDIEPEQVAGEMLAVGDTKQIDLELGDTETLVSFVSDCPEALSVSETGEITALAEHTVTITATVWQTEFTPAPLTLLQRIRQELRIFIGLEERVDYDALEPQVTRIVEYEFVITGVPTEPVDFLIEMYVGDEADFDLDKEENEVVHLTSGDMAIAIIENYTTLIAVGAGETTLTATFGIETEIDGETVFLAMHAKTFPLKINAEPVRQGNSGGSSSSGGGTRGSINPSTGQGGSAGGSGGSSGSGGSGGSGGTITPPRTYPLPSESEVAGFVSQARSYATGLGLGINSGLNTGNAGYSSPACTWETPWANVKGEVYWQIDQVYAMAIADPGFQAGMAVINITYTFYNGEYYIYVMWG